MENWQKILLVIIIFIFILALDLILYFKTDNLIDDTLTDLSKIEKSLEKNNLEESKKKTEDINKKWFKYENVLSFFIEHDEIEKVSTKMVIIKENTKNEEYNAALEDVVETKFILKHIKDKYNLTMKNIF